MRRAGRALLFVLFCALVLEAGARTYWWIARRVPPWRPAYVTLAFFPELRHGLQSVRSDDRYDVLLLGGSALNYASSTLERRLAERTRRPVHMRNTAWPSHSSRDSLVKYEFLEDSRFDLVIFYHGINEVRANNVPPENFRVDYSHYWWYETVNALAAREELRFAAAPFTLQYLWLQIVERFGWRDYVPQHFPREDWTRYGHEIRTRDAFRRNLEGIAEIAERRGDPLLLMTFAWYLPEEYSEERFRAGELPYAEIERSVFPVEIWGVAANVVEGIRVHNDVVREVARSHPEALFVDQEALMPRSGELFGDVCHMSEAGLEIFADNLLQRIAPSADPDCYNDGRPGRSGSRWILMTSLTAAPTLPRRLIYGRDLLYELVVRDMKLRYKRSILGLVWTLINPLAQLLVFDFVFRVVFQVKIPNYTAFLFIGIVSWTWFNGALLQATNAILENRDLIRQPHFPSSILPNVTVMSHLLHLLLTVPIVLVLLWVTGISLTPVALLAPLVVALQYVLILSLAYFVASLHVTFRDVQYILGILLMLGFYLTPILYDASIVPERYQPLYRLNLMGHVIDAYRAVLLHGELPNLGRLAVVGAASAAQLVLGYAFFRRASARFAEQI